MAYKDPEKERAYHVEYRAANREEKRAYAANYYAAHREERANYRAANRETRRAYAANWYAAHREQVRAYAANSRAKRRGAPQCDHASCLALGATQLAWQTNDHVCWICGTPVWQGVNLHMDHVLPVSKGGPHCADNLRPACAVCNLRKHAKLPEELPAPNWRAP